MFTIEQIKAAHAKVKSGADFPAYVQELIRLGVKSYDTFVSDGHAVYRGENNYQKVSTAKYETLTVANKSDETAFKLKLKIHQQGQTDYMTFCRDAAEAGVEKWTVDMQQMTCIYYDKAGNNMLAETIPGV
jgi:Phage envelope protein